LLIIINEKMNTRKLL